MPNVHALANQRRVYALRAGRRRKNELLLDAILIHADANLGKVSILPVPRLANNLEVVGIDQGQMKIVIRDVAVVLARPDERRVPQAPCANKIFDCRLMKSARRTLEHRTKL